MCEQSIIDRVVHDRHNKGREMIRKNGFTVEIEWFDYLLGSGKHYAHYKMTQEEEAKCIETDAVHHVIHGENYVALKDGARYSIRLHNSKWTDADAEITIDNVFHGKFRVPADHSIKISSSAFNNEWYKFKSDFTLAHAHEGLIPYIPETGETFNIMHITFYPEVKSRGYKSCSTRPPYPQEDRGFRWVKPSDLGQYLIKLRKKETHAYETESMRDMKSEDERRYTTYVPDIHDIDTDNITTISLALAKAE